MTDLSHRAEADEQMDEATLDAATYATIVAQLEQVNRMTLGFRATLAFFARACRGRDRVRVLEVGYGDGGLLRALARQAARRGVTAELVGIDLNPRSAPIAEARTPAALPIRYLTGDYAAQAGGGFDLIVSNLVAHHMTREQLVAFLRFMEAEARRGWTVNDLLRHGFAHRTYPWLARAMRWHRIVREDGQLSIARSYRPAEWPPLLADAGIPAGAARVHRAFPFRLCVERLR